MFGGEVWDTLPKTNIAPLLGTRGYVSFGERNLELVPFRLCAMDGFPLYITGLKPATASSPTLVNKHKKIAHFGRWQLKHLGWKMSFLLRMLLGRCHVSFGGVYLFLNIRQCNCYITWQGKTGKSQPQSSFITFQPSILIGFHVKPPGSSKPSLFKRWMFHVTVAFETAVVSFKAFRGGLRSWCESTTEMASSIGCDGRCWRRSNHNASDSWIRKKTKETTRGWFQIIFYLFSPRKLGNMNQFWLIFFQRGWNHQLETCWQNGEDDNFGDYDGG